MVRASRFTQIAATILLTALPATLAYAQDNCQLQLVGGARLGYDEFGRPMVPATIEGRNKFILLDTGGFTNTLEMATAQELGLRIGTAQIAIVGVSGESSSQSVRPREYRINNLNLADHQVMISPGEPGVISDTQPVGTLAPGAFQTFDLELDFSDNLFLLYSRDHCDGAFVQRLPPGTPVAVVPFSVNESYHVQFPVVIDGLRLTAIMDTGASQTSLSLPVAERELGVDVSSAEVEEIGSITGAYEAAVYRRQFESLEIEGIMVSNPDLVLLPDLVSTRVRMTSRGFTPNEGPSFAPVILGMSILRNFYIYIAYGERKIYFSSVAAIRQ